MFERMAKKFLSWILRVDGIDNIEIVIRSDGYTYRHRNKELEENIKTTLSKIK